MKILGICGSHRKGKSFSVLNTIKENNPDIEFKLLLLKDLNLEQCKGCYVCILKGESKCPLKDDRDVIINEMEDADGLIIASPVYSVNITPILKNFIDRLGFFSHRPHFFNKYAMAISTCSAFGADDTNKYLNKILSIMGFSLAPALQLKFLPGKMSEIAKQENEQLTINAFNTLVSRIKSGVRDKPKMGLIIMFHIYKLASELGKNAMTADYEYYKDKIDYFYPRKINFFQKMIAKNIVKKMAKHWH